MEYIPSTADLDKYERAKAAKGLMNVSITATIVSLFAFVVGLIQILRDDPRWWWYIGIQWICVVLGEVYKRQAKKIFPEGFEK